jgi:hypothetical protein
MGDMNRVDINLVSWGSHVLKIDGDRWKGLTAINWDDKVDVAYGWGMTRSHAPIGRTAGKYTPPTVKLTMHRHMWSMLLVYLKSKAVDQKSYSQYKFHMMLQVIEGTMFSDYEFQSCRVVSRNGKAEENPDPAMVDIEISVMRAVEDGATLWDSSQEIV